MAEDFAGDEEALRNRQGAHLYPLGRALRATFDADNHDSLSNDVTGLMLDLARVPFEDPRDIAPETWPAPPPAPLTVPRRGLVARIGLLWRAAAADRRSLRR